MHSLSDGRRASAESLFFSFSKRLHPILYQAELLSSGKWEHFACLGQAPEEWLWVLLTYLG